MRDTSDNHQSSDEQRDDSGDSDDDYLYICPACSTLTYVDIDECAACGATEDQLSLAIVQEGDE